MPNTARKVFRLSLSTALALAFAYGAGVPFPFIVPIITLILGAQFARPMKFKMMLSLMVVVAVTLGIGLALIPLLLHYSIAAVLLMAAGLWFSCFIAVNSGKGALGTLLAIGFALIPAAGIIDFSVALGIIQVLLAGITVAIVCQWIVYPLFPDVSASRPEQASTNSQAININASWIALRFTLVVLPPVILALINPTDLIKLIMKSILIGQQVTVLDANRAGKELLGSTLLGGLYAIIFWMLLKIHPNLWMFFLLALLFLTYFSSKMFRLSGKKYSSSFWKDIAVTMLILLGSAVQDSVAGADVYQAFVIRITLFMMLSLYAWVMIHILEFVRLRYERRAVIMPVHRGGEYAV